MFMEVRSERSTSPVTKLSVTSKAFVHYCDRLSARSTMYICRTPYGHTRGLPNPLHNKPTKNPFVETSTNSQKNSMKRRWIQWSWLTLSKYYKTNLWEKHFKYLIMIGSKVFLVSFLKKDAQWCKRIIKRRKK